jgi:hypothetical protein
VTKDVVFGTIFAAHSRQKTNSVFLPPSFKFDPE